VVVDPAAASLKLQLVQDKVPGVTDADNTVQHGIQLVATLLETNQLLITDRCAGWIEEAPGYVWDPKETEKGHDAPVKADDHSLDAARYIITTTEPLWRPYLQLLDEEGQNAA
jgi:phage terminase large subunit